MTAACAFIGQLRRDLLLGVRHRSDLVTPMLFFVFVVCLFPLGLRPEQDVLMTIAPAVIWVAALLSTLLGLERLFRTDYEDGSLDLLLLSPHPTALLVLARILSHWLATGLVLVLVSPALALILGVPVKVWPVLLLSLLLGTPTLSLVGAIGVALTVGLPRGGMLLALVVLPLYVPILIFGASSLAAAMSGLPVAAPLYLLGALLALGLTLAPIATAAALRVSVE
jgi:heme exporter protein B